MNKLLFFIALVTFCLVAHGQPLPDTNRFNRFVMHQHKYAKIEILPGQPTYVDTGLGKAATVEQMFGLLFWKMDRRIDLLSRRIDSLQHRLNAYKKPPYTVGLDDGMATAVLYKPQLGPPDECWAIRVRCSCPCHTPGNNIWHLVYCCNNGWLFADRNGNLSKISPCRVKR